MITHTHGRAFSAAVVALLAAGVIVVAQDKKPPQESERKVKEAEVPAAALTGLKKIAGAAAFTEFAEEVEHGSKFYEGSWKGPDGKVDALVTASGDMVELEEAIPADKVPAAVRAAFEKEAGKEATIKYEKKTLVVYEAHFKKDGKGREMILTPDGRPYHEEKSQDDGDEDD